MPLAEPRTSLSFPEGPEALEMARVGLRALARMAEHWELTVDEQRLILGGLPKTTSEGPIRPLEQALLVELSQGLQHLPFEQGSQRFPGKEELGDRSGHKQP